MRLGLYAPRRSSFWLVGPLAKAALKRGHEVIALKDMRALKPGDDWTPEERRRDLPGSSQGWITEFDGDWIASAPPRQNWLPSALLHADRLGIRLCSIDPWLEVLSIPFADCYDLTHRTIRHGLVPADGLQDVKMGDPRDLVWFPPKTHIPGLRARLWREFLIRFLAVNLARHAKRLGLRFVIKTRGKMELSDWVLGLADDVASDAALYPHDSLRVMSTAALTVSHHSTSSLESAAAAVRCLNIQIPQPHLVNYPHWALMAAHHGTPYAWTGVIDSMSTAKAFRWLRKWTPREVIDMDQRAAYLDTWLGGRVMGTSDWLLDEMEKRA